MAEDPSERLAREAARREVLEGVALDELVDALVTQRQAELLAMSEAVA